MIEFCVESVWYSFFASIIFLVWLLKSPKKDTNFNSLPVILTGTLYVISGVFFGIGFTIGLLEFAMNIINQK